MSFQHARDDEMFVIEKRLPLDRYETFELVGDYVYSLHFRSHDHVNLVANMGDHFVVVSVVEQLVSVEHPARFLFVIRTVESEVVRAIWIGGLNASLKSGLFSCCHPSPLREAFGRLSLPFDRFLALPDSPEVESSLLDCEQSYLRSKFKCGIMLQRDDLAAEGQILWNCKNTPDFLEFLGAIGDTVELQGFKGFAGGLDVKNNRHGTHSLYATYEGNEIMFHVSTYLPFDDRDPQQLVRKRHIGNDPVVILFQDGDDPTPIGPSFFRSKIVHTKILVWINRTPFQKYWKIAIFNRVGVEPFVPRIPEPAVFHDIRDLVSFLYQKIICASRSAWKAQNLEDNNRQFRDGLFRRLWGTASGAPSP